MLHYTSSLAHSPRLWVYLIYFSIQPLPLIFYLFILYFLPQPSSVIPPSILPFSLSLACFLPTELYICSGALSLHHSTEPSGRPGRNERKRERQRERKHNSNSSSIWQLGLKRLATQDLSILYLHQASWSAHCSPFSSLPPPHRIHPCSLFSFPCLELSVFLVYAVPPSPLPYFPCWALLILDTGRLGLEFFCIHFYSIHIV